LLAFYAAASVLATLVGGVVLWGLIDAALHVSEAGVRAIATLAILAATGFVAWKFALPAWRTRPSLLSVAQRIEQRWPELGDRLSSSLAFLGQEESDALAGSAALRRAVVAETMSKAEQLPFSAAIDGRPTWRVGIISAFVLLTAVGLAIVFPAGAKLVLARTLNPWTSATWPRRHQLDIEKASERLAKGADFEAIVIDRAGPLPEVVTIEYQFEDDGKTQSREMKLLDGKMVHRLEGVTRSFRYRATGGDDTSMDWRDLQVLEPPTITSLTAKVLPPAYTGWPAAASTPDFRALEGSRIELTGTVDKPIQSAALKLEGAGTPTEAAIAVSSDGLSFTLPASADKPWLLSQANAYALELTSVEGFTTTSARNDLRVVPDRPPAVVVEQPADNVSVTPQAVLPLRVLVKDDLAIARIELKYLRSDESEAGEQTVELYVGREQAEAVKVSPLKEGTLAGESRTVEYNWNLAEIKNLAPGVTLTWHVSSSDFKPQAGLSPAQRLVIISQEELEDRIAQRQNAILLQLQEVLRKEQKSRSDVAALGTQLETIGRLGKQDLDQLQSVELEQRQVQRGLTSDSDGVLAQVKLLLGELASNRVDSPEVVRRMTALAKEIDRLKREPLPAAERELNTALKIVRDDIDKNGDVSPDAKKGDTAAKAATSTALASAGGAQDETITTLERLLGDLEEFDNYRRFAREVSRLRSDQTALQKETQALQPKTLSKSPRDLSPQELASLRRAAQKQTELARQIDKLVGRMAEARTKLNDSQPLAASTLADALESARQAGISSQMLDTARSIEQNQLGNAGEAQTNIGEALSELQDILSNRKEHELSRRIKQLRDSAGELDNTLTQLQGVKKRTEAAAKVGNEAERKRQLERLSREQKKLAEQAERLARKLERLQSEQAGQKVSQAGGKTGDASQAIQEGNSQKSLEDLADAQKRLEEAKQQLQQDIAQAEQDLFFEQVAKLEQAIQGLIARQKTVIDETARLEGLKKNQDGEWTPSQRTSVRSVTEQERDLVGETAAFAQKLKEAAAFDLALEGAVREMNRATARLDRFLTNDETQASEKIALARLEQVLEALKPEPPGDMPPMEDPMGNMGPGNQGPQMPPGDAVHLLAELKLLKLMQQEINRRTAEIEKQAANAQNLTPEQEKELDDLSQEQGKLADLVLNLGEKAAKQAASGPATAEPPDQEKKPGKNPLDDELNKALDNELLPGRK
jgi:hypothetical protein